MPATNFCKSKSYHLNPHGDRDPFHGAVPQRYPQNIQAHLGHEEKFGAFGGGKRLRQFYARWSMMMEAESWSDVDLETKYY